MSNNTLDQGNAWREAVGAVEKKAYPEGINAFEQAMLQKATQDHTKLVPGYECLREVLQRAYDQAARGKGAERHAQDQPFDQQPMQKLIELYGVGFALGQAGKKMQESQRLKRDPAIRELLGAINYIAGAVIHLEKNNHVSE